MDTALELFASRGYHGTSISTIAKSAGISKGLLYNYFNGKEELVIEIMKSGFLDMVSAFDPNHDNVLTREELKIFVIGVMENAATKTHFWKLYFSVISQPIVNQVAFGEIMQIAMPIFKILTEYFNKTGVKNPEAEARFFTALLDGITLNYVYDPKNYPLQETLERILDIYDLKETNPKFRE